jgi:superfamily II RNA helicase
MVLNLLLSHDTDQIEALLKKSFASYCLDKRAKKRQRHKGPRKTKDFLWHDFKRHLGFLKRTGYVTQDNTLTESGMWASRLRIDQPLLLAEGFRLGILPESDPGLLAAIVAAFVNERETHDRIDKKHYPKNLLKTFSRTKTGLTPLAFEMTRNGFFVPPLFFRPAVCIYAWALQCSWAKALQLAEIEEGDLAMLILRTADNLRHIKALRRVFPQAAETADKAIELILREPVVMDYV